MDGHKAHTGDEFDWKREGMRLLGRPMYRWEDEIRMDIR
jgi:hypothetical protein